MIIRGFVSAANGMQALINQNDSTASNVANVNTTGYKKQNLIFKDIYDANIVQKLPDTGDVTSIGALSVGSQVQKLTYDFSQGTLTKTEGTFDVAIEGDGFFKVRSSGGDISYTRNGSFTMNNNGNLVTKDGDYVLDGQNQPIKIQTNGVVMHSMNDIIINEDGQIELMNNNIPTMLQRIGVYDFGNKEDMVCIGGSKFKPASTNMNPEVKPTKFRIVQGSLEMSNANSVNEMIKTINTSRNYETLSKVIKSSADSLEEVMGIGKL